MCTHPTTHLVYVSLPLQLVRELGPLFVLLRLQPQGLAGSLGLLLYSLQLPNKGRNAGNTRKTNGDNKNQSEKVSEKGWRVGGVENGLASLHGQRLL